ncbi:hypothetical protein SB6412_05376 [Klebsiella pasteurii]|nr:hypothetical protein SB6412_05376 [Klebsiella pasteurii]
MHMSKWNIAAFPKEEQELNGNSLNIFASISVNGLKFISRTVSSCRAQMRPNIINRAMISRIDFLTQCVQGG